MRFARVPQTAAASGWVAQTVALRPYSRPDPPVRAGQEFGQSRKPRWDGEHVAGPGTRVIPVMAGSTAGRIGRMGAGLAHHGAGWVIPKAELVVRASSAASTPNDGLLWEDTSKWR